MKRQLNSFFLALFVFASLSVLTSCRVSSGKFRIEGRLRNINQGEFYVYSPDGGLVGIDTIRVADGRFSYETSLADEATYMIVFPNSSEQAVFGKSGATAKISGDVTHLKEIEIEGTDENEQLTELRRHLINQTPPEQKKSVIQFINDNPGSIVTVHLIDKYLLQAEKPNYKEAYDLVDSMLKKVPGNIRLQALRKQLETVRNMTDFKRLPDFSATDIYGKPVNAFTLKSELNVVLFWASWMSENYSLISQMQTLKREYGPRLAVLSICIDPQKDDCKRRSDRDSLKWATVCDGKMWQSPLLRKFCVIDVPCYMLIDRSGRVIERDIALNDLKEKIEKRLKKAE